MVSTTVADRINFGNCHLKILDVTNASSSGSTLTMSGFDKVLAVKAVNNTDSSDTFKESKGAESSSSTKNQVTLTPATDNDDGQAWIWVR